MATPSKWKGKFGDRKLGKSSFGSTKKESIVSEKEEVKVEVTKEDVPEKEVIEVVAKAKTAVKEEVKAVSVKSLKKADWQKLATDSGVEFTSKNTIRSLVELIGATVKADVSIEKDDLLKQEVYSKLLLAKSAPKKVETKSEVKKEVVKEKIKTIEKKVVKVKEDKPVFKEEAKPERKERHARYEEKVRLDATGAEARIRLNKFIANCGVCSRREADKLIANKEISVNGEVITEMGYKVTDDDEVAHKGKVLSRQKFQYVLLNKPKDCVTTMKDTHDRTTVMEYVKDACPERIYPVGRLDRNTTGLLLLTNDGDLAKRLTHPSHEVKKIYIAKLDREMATDTIQQLIDGVDLEDGFSKFDECAFAQKDRSDLVLCVLHSGKNRIVRRMFEEVGFKVLNLDRVEFAGVKKGNLQRGTYRNLTTKEIGFLKMS